LVLLIFIKMKTILEMFLLLSLITWTFPHLLYAYIVYLYCVPILCIFIVYLYCVSLLCGGLRGLVGSTLGHRSLPPKFESRRENIWRVFHLWLPFIRFGGHSAHLAYHVHKSGRKTSINHRIYIVYLYFTHKSLMFVMGNNE